jgi:hypothetical protein
MNLHTVITHDDGYYSVTPNIEGLPVVYHPNAMVYEQPHYIHYPVLHHMDVFPVDSFVHIHNMTPVAVHTDTFVHEDYSKESHYFNEDTKLSKEEQKSCRCYLHIQEKNNCDRNEWNKAPGCYNPYAVCNRRLPAIRSCWKDYDFDDFTDSELRGYARAHGLKPASLNRDDILLAIREKVV